MSGPDFTTTSSRSIKNDRALSHNEVIAQFADAMRAAGLIVDASEVIPNDPKFQRWKTVGGKGSRKNGYSKLFLDDHPAGVFGDWGSGEHHEWFAETGASPPSAEEMKYRREMMKRVRAERDAEIKQGHEMAAERAKKHWKNAVPAADDHPYLTRKGVQAHGLRVGKWWKWDQEEGKPYVACEEALLVPKYGLNGDVRSLQAIFPGKIAINGEHRDKDYLGGAEKDGVFHVIGKALMIDGRKVVIVAEGYATAASIYAATGHCVLVAFDTGNLLHTAQVFRDKYADAVIVFAADNDWGTVAPVKNPGIHFARKAATAVNGVVAIPQFEDASDLPKGGDFNDLHQREGAGAVEALINAALYPAPPAEAEAPEHKPDGDLPWAGEPQFPAEAREVPRASKPTTQAEAEDAAIQQMEQQAGFRVMGYQRDTTYIYAYGKRQILECKTFSVSMLQKIAPTGFWEDHFRGKNGINVNAAAEFIERTAERRGIYDPNCVRNGGAWVDAGRHVFHHGSDLSVDGVRMPVTAIRSKFVYEATLPLPTPADVAMTDAEGKHVYDIAKRFNWERNSSAALLAGWTLLAPVCGSLKWRPHIFLTGEAGNGKSTILRDYVHALIGDGGCVFAQGSSTEAGVRQDIGSTSLPCLIDEAEKNTPREQQRIEALLALIRQSSTESGAKTLKGTVGGEGMKFNVRSMFCMAAIYTGLERKSDVDRLSVLSLKPARGDAAAAQRWDVTKELLHKLGDEDANMRGKMLRRALDTMPTILASIEVFKKVAAEKFGSARSGDQYGTMLAGAWCLTNSTVATHEQARAMMDALDWTAHAEAAEADDSEAALEVLMGAFITVMGVKHSVHNLISFALGAEVEGRSLGSRQARTELRQHGIALEGSKLALSNTAPALKALLANTPFATDPRTAFLRLKGAESGSDNNKKWFNGKKSRVVFLPLDSIGFGGKNIKSEDEIFS